VLLLEVRINKMAWNDLSPEQQDAWKKKNFNSNIKVSEATIQKLRDGKTKSANIKKYAGTNNKQIREAMNRFYGKGWDKGAKPNKPNKPDTPSAPSSPNWRGPSIRSVEGSAGYSAPKKGKGKGKSGATIKLTGSSPTLWQGQAARQMTKAGYKIPKTSAADRAMMATMFIPGVGLVARGAIMGTKAAAAGARLATSARAAAGAKVFANARGLGSGSRAAASVRAASAKAAEQAARRSAAAKAGAATRSANKAAASKAATEQAARRAAAAAKGAATRAANKAAADKAARAAARKAAAKAAAKKAAKAGK
jgi:hypothetical protein